MCAGDGGVHPVLTAEAAGWVCRVATRSRAGAWTVGTQKIGYEISEAIDLLIQSERTINTTGIDVWRVDVGYSEDREMADELLVENELEAIE